MDTMDSRADSAGAPFRPYQDSGLSQTGEAMGNGLFKPEDERTPAPRGLIVLLYALMGVFLFTGCAPQVLKQRVPVSTNPTGAKVYVDGTPSGETPTTVELERTQSHVLTLLKENYRQTDVVIQQRKKSEEQLFKAINSGVTTGMMFKDPGMGMMRAMDSYSTQEKTGEAYELWPSAVTVELEPLEGVEGSPHRSDQTRQNDRGSAQPERERTGAEQSDSGAMTKGALTAAAVAGAVAVGNREKRWETSSSTKTSVRPDGTQVTTHSSTSVGVSVNPAGVLNLINTLYK